MITVSLVRAYLFCPLRAYIEGLGLRPDRGPAVEAGAAVHRAYEMLSLKLAEAGEISRSHVEEVSRETGLPLGEVERLARFRESIGLAGRPVRVEVELESRRLGLRGRLDILEGSTPVEVKYRGGVGKEDLIQLALYAMMLEEHGTRVEVGYIDLLREPRRVRVELGKELRSRALKALRGAKVALLEPRPPRRGAPCAACDVRRECAVFLGGVARPAPA